MCGRASRALLSELRAGRLGARRLRRLAPRSVYGRLEARSARYARLATFAASHLSAGCHSTRINEIYHPVKFEDDWMHIREATKKSKKIASEGIRTCGFGNVVHPCGRALYLWSGENSVFRRWFRIVPVGNVMPIALCI